MANTILIKRGLKTSVPTLDIGELGLATDTNEVFIGTPTGNKLVNSSGGGGTVAWQDILNKPELYNKAEIDLMLGDIESALDAILGV